MAIHRQVTECYAEFISPLNMHACMPLFYELCVEVAYPVSEGSSASLLVLVENVALFVFVSIANWISVEYQTVLTVGVCGVCLVLLSLARESYRRL